MRGVITAFWDIDGTLVESPKGRADLFSDAVAALGVQPIEPEGPREGFTDRKLAEVPGIGLAALALSMVAVGYLGPAVATQHDAPTGRSIAALVGLAILCTAIAFVVFFALIREVGPARATVITFINPVVALALGVVVLGEHLSWGQLVGLPVVLVGCYLAAGRRTDEGPLLIPEP